MVEQSESEAPWLCPKCLTVRGAPSCPCDRCGSQRDQILLANPRGLPLGEISRLLEDMSKHAELDVLLADRWISSLQNQSKALLRGGASPEASLFWIRLHGAIAELPLTFVKSAELLSHAPPSLFQQMHSTASGSHAATTLGLRWRVHMAATELASPLDENELIYLEWRRHVEAHLLQGAYRLRLRVGKNALLETLEIKVLGIRKSTVEIWEAIRMVQQKSGVDDRQVAEHFARKLARPIDHLAKAQALYMRHAWRREDGSPAEAPNEFLHLTGYARR